MLAFRYSPRKNWLFYLLVIAYGGLIGRMTIALWFGDGVNVYATYSSATNAAEMIIDANYVYWSKSSFLFLSMFLTALNFDYRFSVGFACSFWSLSLIAMFGVSLVLALAACVGIALIAVQFSRREIFDGSNSTHE